MSEWKTMESAPKDGTPVDLWIVRPGLDPQQCRVPDCHWGRVTAYYEEEVNSAKSPAWVCEQIGHGGEPYWGEVEWGDDEAGQRVTHWMPLPQPPKESE